MLLCARQDVNSAQHFIILVHRQQNTDSSQERVHRPVQVLTRVKSEHTLILASLACFFSLFNSSSQMES